MGAAAKPRKRRVSVLTRERQRERMLALPAEELAARVARMQEGRRRARSPERLPAIESRMDELAVEYRQAETFEQRHAIREELRELGRQRYSIKWHAAE